MKKLLIGLVGAAMVMTAGAVITDTQEFETSFSDFVADVQNEDESELVAHGTAPSVGVPYPCNGFGEKYLSIDTGDATLWRANSAAGKVYFDMAVQFQPVTEPLEALPAGSKFAVYLNSNLKVVVAAGLSDSDRTLTNYETTTTLAAGTWARLTVSADTGACSFNVKIDENLVATADDKRSFPFLTADSTISSIGFKGAGALDDFVARTTDPFIQDPATMIGGEGYASLADAIAEAGDSDVIVLQSDNQEDVQLAEGQSFKLDAHGHEYSGTVTSYNGSRLVRKEENNVISYSQLPPCKPSICINFTDSGKGLTTNDDVGLADYGVPGTSWNNFAANNATYTTVNAVDSTGAASEISGVSVAITGTRGSWACSELESASNPLQGYIDEANTYMTPTVTVSGIPYYKYRVIVYHSTDSGNVPFGYDTINGANYTYVNDALAEDTTAWGASGEANSANAIAEGVNVLVTEALSGPTLTVVGHRAGGNPNARGCIAAIQIIEVKPDVGDNDLVIPVSGDTTYTVDAEHQLSGTVYLTGIGTLTLDGSAKISAATIDVSKGVTLNVNADRLDGTTFTGAGTVVYDTTAPVEGKGWANSGWSGTVWIKNQSVEAFEGTKYGNAGSTVRFTGVAGYLQTSSKNGSTYVHTVPLELVDEGNTIAFTYNNGWGGNLVKINTLKGSGTLKTQGSGAGEHIYIVDASDFTGVFNLTTKSVYVGGDTPDYSSSTGQSGKLDIRSGAVLTVHSGKTWTANGGFVVNGTLNDNGTLSSNASPAISGEGTVVFCGVPSPTGDAWWKNAAWTGTVEIKGVTSISGNNYAFSDYGNASSTVKLTNCSGWLKNNYTCVPALEIGGTFSWNDGSSGLGNVFKVSTLKGSGSISIPNQGAPTAVWQITDDWSEFTGAVVGNNGAGKRVLVFGSTLPTSITAGEIYISAGATLNLDNSSSAWWGVGMKFVVDGTVKATARTKWGGGTAMELGDTGVLEITRSDSAYSDDGGTDYGNVTGTGTIKFSGDGFTVISQSIPTSLKFAAEKASGSVVPVAGATIGSLTGSKGFRSDWGNNGEGGRYLTIKQSMDTDWDGSINQAGGHRLTGVIVDPGEGATGTLKMTATQAASSTLTVNGSVNLTGTWIGATTVAGTLGGTGAITGNVTFNDGATLKVDSLSEKLDVSGTLTLTGAISVYLPEGTMSASDIIPATSINVSGATFNVYVGGTLRRNMKVCAEDGKLNVKSLGALIIYN